jgi:hypothetical protein
LIGGKDFLDSADFEREAETARKLVNVKASFIGSYRELSDNQTHFLIKQWRRGSMVPPVPPQLVPSPFFLAKIVLSILI